MYEDSFRRILDSAKKNSLTFFVGAGVSTISKAPTWSDLINAICHEMNIGEKERYSSDEYLKFPQMYYCSTGKNYTKYFSFVESCLNGKELRPNIIHKMLFELNPQSIITTNFDELLEDAAVQNCQAFKTIACDSEIPNINGNRFILKLHGDLKHKNIVFKEDDYLNYSEEFKLIETILKSIFATNTVVFIGYGLNDYNIKLILNWTKSILKSNFNKPLFIYTDNDELSEQELLYQESKGLTVIEYQKLLGDLPKDIDYVERYTTVINAIKNSSEFNVEGKDKFKLFDVLYRLVKPINEMKALRMQDIKGKLYPYIVVREDGVIYNHPDINSILEYFIEINDMSGHEKECLPDEVYKKYKTIIDVFSKARITHIKIECKYKVIDGVKINFADSKCINFEYSEMYKYVNKQYNNLNDNYRKAYYLAKLKKYKEACSLFYDVATKSFKEQNYLLYYLAHINCNNVSTAMRCINNSIFYNNYYNTDVIDKVKPDIGNLPIEFQKEYSVFLDVNSQDLLYKIFYYSFEDGEKLKNAIESSSVEFGLTSIGKVIFWINNNLHFMLGNGIYIDEFSEFKSTIKNLMSLLIYKYSAQSKAASYYDPILEEIQSNKIEFDEIDFYCLVEYFDSDEIIKLFRKYKIDTLTFKSIEKIEKAIMNLIAYYNIILKE